MSEEAIRKPRRPALPSSFWGLAVLLGSQAAVMRMRPDKTPLLLAVLVSLGVCLVAARALWQGRHAAALLLCVGSCLALGLTTAGLRSAFDRRAAEELSHTSASLLEFKVVGDPSPTDSGFMARARILDDDQTKGELWLRTSEQLCLGDTLRCVGRFSPAGDDEWGLSSRAQGIIGSLSIKRVLELKKDQGLLGVLMDMRRSSLSTIEPEKSAGRAVLAGSICGDRTQMRASGVEDLFASCGVSHLVAVSGGHIAIVASAVSAALSRSRLGPLPRMLVVLLLSGCFVLFSGLAISALRSWLMVAASLIPQAVFRRSDGVSSACLVCLCMTVFDPSCSGQLSFLLSALSVIGLCLFAPYMGYVLQLIAGPSLIKRMWTVAQKLPRPLGHLLSDAVSTLAQALAATLVCQLVTLPLTSAVFGTVSLVAPLANVLLALPFSGLVTLGLMGLCCQAIPGVGTALLIAASAFSSASVSILALLARLPFASVALQAPLPLLAALVGTLALLLLLWWPSLSRCMIAMPAVLLSLVLGLVLLRFRFLSPARVVVLDVGQGDAILVQDGSAAVLVDAGPSGNLAPALARQHVLHLDAVILTHLHDDHIGGLDDLSSSVYADQVFVADGVSSSMNATLKDKVASVSGKQACELAYGDRLQVGDFSLEVVSPTEPVDGSENSHSLELVGAYEKQGKDLSFLLTGDAEEQETAACLARGDVGDIDFLKVGHHGSAVSLDKRSAQSLDAEVAVASAGEGNSYGHPDPACVETLESAGSLFLCTKDRGDVEIRPGSVGPQVIYAH